MSFAISSNPSRFFPATIILISLLFVAGTTGCSSSGTSTGPHLSGNTSVLLLLSSTANAQLSQFNLQFKTLSLSSQSGKTVNLISAQEPSESIHLNGGIEPFGVVTIPQDIYTAATATIGGADFTCLTVLPPSSNSPGSLDISEYAYGNTPNANVTVNLPDPVTITGNNMSLLLDLLISKSANYSSCAQNIGATYSITPTFNLTTTTLSSNPTNSGNGKVSGLEGEIASLSKGNGFSITVPEGPGGTRALTVSTNTSTAYQGVSNLVSLVAGMFVDVDGAIQADGSLLATRIAVQDPSAVNVLSGPLLDVAASVPVLSMYGRQQQGALVTGPGGPPSYAGGAPYFDFSNATFQISGQFTNLQNLPFVPSFTASNMVAGQNIEVTAPALVFKGGVYTPATTITLIPQIVNGTVMGSTTSGGFLIYSVSLANYDLFPTMAVQPGQTTLLTNPSEVEVYVDSKTQELNTTALTSGNTLRFYGLVFNDNGTLRMDCAQISDGVLFSTQSQSNSPQQMGQSRSVVNQAAGSLLQVITSITRSR